MILLLSSLILTVLAIIFAMLKIRWYHFIWALLPIDMYGVRTFGFTLKPSMLFGAIIIIFAVYHRYSGQERVNSVGESRYRPLTILALIFIFIFMLWADLSNNGGMSSLLQQFMWLLIVAIAVAYTSLIHNIGGLSNAFRAISITTQAYILMFICVYLAASLFGPDHWVARSHWEPGILIRFINSREIRLRGFFIDTNAFFTSLSVGVAAILIRGVKARYKIQNWLGIAAAYYAAYLTNSRNTLIIMLFFLGVALMRNQSSNPTDLYRLKRRIACISSLSLIILILCCCYNLDDRLIACYTQHYAGHSDISAQYGRLAIWVYNWNLIKDHLIFGIGQGILQKESYRDFHNTWLEMCGANGIATGVLYLGLSLAVLFTYLRRRKYVKYLEPEYLGMYDAWLLGYIGVLISLTTVSNINNSYLLFLMLLLPTATDILHGLANNEKGVVKNGAFCESAV